MGVGTEDIGAPQGGRGWRGAGEGQPQECDGSSSVSWTNTCFFSAGDYLPRKPLTGALLASGPSLCLAPFVLLLFTLEPRDQTLGVPSLSTSYDDRVAAASASPVASDEHPPQHLYFFKSPFPLSLGVE